VPDPTTDNDDPIEDELGVEDDDDLREDAAALFGIDTGDDPLPIDVDAIDGKGGGGTVTATRTGSTSTHGTSTTGAGKHKSGVWVDFDEIKDANDVQIAAICKMCKTRLSARSAAGTGHLIRHQNSCLKKKDRANRV
jgi:hypothetical protein